MDSVRTRDFARRRCSIRACAAAAHRPGTGQGVTLLNGVIVLDVVYAVGVIALFALIGLLAKAVEKL